MICQLINGTFERNKEPAEVLNKNNIGFNILNNNIHE